MANKVTKRWQKFSCERGNADLNNNEVGCQSQHSHLMATASRQVTPQFQSSWNGIKVSVRTEDNIVLWTSPKGGLGGRGACTEPWNSWSYVHSLASCRWPSPPQAPPPLVLLCCTKVNSHSDKVYLKDFTFTLNAS